MHKSILFLLILTCSCFVSGQKMTKPEAYFLYFKTWNFIKYYHPDLASGKTDADSLFFKHLNGFGQVIDKAAFNKQITQLLNELSKPLSESKAMEENKDVIRKNLDFTWFEKNTFFEKTNKQQLSTIFKNRYTTNNHYYLPEKSFDALIPHEKEYVFPEHKGIPTEYGMLALAKIQGAVDYLYPHKYLMEQHFDQLLKSQVIPMLESKSRKDYELILLKLVASLQDSHSFSFYKQLSAKKEIFRNPVYPPFDYHVFADGILVTGIIIPEACQSADLKTGDYITSINGQTVPDRIKELSLLLSTSNRQTLLYHLSNYIENLIWSSGSKQFELEVLRNGQKESKIVSFLGSGDAGLQTLNSYLGSIQPQRPEHDSLTILNGEIAYFNIHETFRFVENTPDAKTNLQIDSILDLAKLKKGIIFDMRAYPDWGGFTYTFLPGSFASNLTPFAKYYEINKREIGTYTHKIGVETYYNADLKVSNEPYKGKVVIIVNPATQSMSEWNTMFIQQIFPNSLTIGEQSAGADGDMKTLNLPGNYEMNFTGNAIFYTDGTEAQKKGVKIDIPVKLTKENFLSGKDYMLQKAMELIEK